MHNRFALLLAIGVIASTSALAQVTVTDTHEGGKPGPKPAPFNMKSAQQAPLNNQAIINMVKSGRQHASIIAVLRSLRGSFDLSPQGCASLRAAAALAPIPRPSRDSPRDARAWSGPPAYPDAKAR